MWSGNEECNEDGQPVRLYQPIQYGRSNVRADDPTASYIGGPASHDKMCSICDQPLLTLLQLHVPTTERSHRVEACNSAACFRKLFVSSKFNFGGSGVVVAERISAEESPRASQQEEAVVTQPTKNATTKNTSEADDWGVSDGGDVGLDDLEAKLAAIETAEPKESIPVNKAESNRGRPKTESGSAENVLPIMALHSVQEPAPHTVSDDPSDVGLHGTSNRKIEEMLARYLAEEEDEDIIQMLNGSASGGAGGEPDQDLTAEEMALLRFSDRIKRCPRQVLRYAKGGEPLWSSPSPEPENCVKRTKAPVKESTSIQIPACDCGAPRIFEYQILPSVLHVLNVDKYANQSQDGNEQWNEWFSCGGMDFGSIAVYTCSKADACTASNDYVVVQDTTDDQPKVPAAGLRQAGDVVVDENATGLDDDDDENVEMDE